MYASDSNASPEPSSSSTVFTPATTCPTIAEDLDTTSKDSASSIPWPGSTYRIQNVSTGKVLALNKKRITLLGLGGPETIRWECIEHDGWLGFQCPSSLMYLGYDRERSEELRCSASVHNLWEYFCIRQRPDGNYVLLMPHYEFWTAAWQQLRPVGVSGETVELMTDWEDPSVVWRFVKVPESRIVT